MIDFKKLINGDKSKKVIDVNTLLKGKKKKHPRKDFILGIVGDQISAPQKRFLKKTKGINIKRFFDTDKDGVIDGLDCQKNNPKRHGTYYHGTSEQNVAQMGFTGGLKPRKGRVYYTDDYKYARLKARQAAEQTNTRPVIITAEKDNLKREGRHFFDEEKLPIKRFKKVEYSE